MSTDFKQVLDVRTENLKKQQSRRQQFSSAAPLSSPASTPSLLTADDEAAQARNQDTAIDMGGGETGLLSALVCTSCVGQLECEIEMFESSLITSLELRTAN